MLTQAQNEMLTRTGPGTAMGALFRRFWVPVLLSRELPEPDGPPVRVSVMGEELIAFRDSTGSVGLVEPRCPHRGANLFFGRNEEGGIRCAYHGWKFDVRRPVPRDPDDGSAMRRPTSTCARGPGSSPIRRGSGASASGPISAPPRRCRRCRTWSSRWSIRRTATSPRSCRSATGRSRRRARRHRALLVPARAGRRGARWPAAAGLWRAGALDAGRWRAALHRRRTRSRPDPGRRPPRRRTARPTGGSRNT